MASLFDICVRLRPFIEDSNEDSQVNNNPGKRLKNKRSKSSAVHQVKRIKKNKKRKNTEKSLFEVNDNKLSVTTDKNFFEYSFNQVFNEKTKNKKIYNELIKKDLKKKVLNGKWMTIMTYGTSGSGKTFTIFGDTYGEEKGIIYHTCEKLFKMFEKKNITNEMTVSLLEIYNEQITNLFPNNRNKVEVVDNPNREMVLLNAQKEKVESAESLISLIQKGAKTRHIAENFSNKRSSRSHMIVLLELSFIYKNSLKNSKIIFLDLAGSERVVFDQKDLMKEGANINKSLLALTNCISILSEGKSHAHVPYRNSKLTRILKEFMTRNNAIKFLVCLKQENTFIEESINTLNYAFKAQKIEQVKNLVKLPTQSISFYKHKINRLEKELKLLRMKNKQSPQRKIKYRPKLEQEVK